MLIILLAYVVGFSQGKYGNWIRIDEPPMPTITIGGKNVEVFLNGYSWCEKPFIPRTTRCVITDSAGTEEIVKTKQIKPVVVEPETKIEVEFDSEYKTSVREFEITRYDTPKEKGVYIYNIHTKWRAEQGESNYSFVIEVQ